ncbi:MAG TPA: response regulator [Ktedonobacteraceae bacterium]|nr:response regulator [Ktedonobacteraceae bacterium]
MVTTPTVLVIDDSYILCEFVALALEKAGYRVIAAADGHEGLMKTFQQRPLCVILDVILPGLSGFEVCRQIRARDPQRTLPIIMISSKNTPMDQKWSLRQGANYYLPKPFTEEVLVQTVTEILPPAFRPRPTTPMKSVVTSYSNTGEMQTLRSLYKLIPHRREDAVLMRSVSPLNDSVIIADKTARRIYAAIDGRKNVDELCYATGMDDSELIEALKYLLAEQRILLYDLKGRLVDSAWLFNLK